MAAEKRNLRCPVSWRQGWDSVSRTGGTKRILLAVGCMGETPLCAPLSFVAFLMRKIP